MHTNKPKIKAPLESIDVILEFVTLTILVCLWCYVVISYTSLPEIIPTHFNGKGAVDGTGGKASIWLLLAITTVISVGIHILTKYPHVHNHMVEITEENAAHNYKMSCRLLRIVNLLTLLLMAYITFAVVRSALGENALIGETFTYIMIVFSVVMPIVLVLCLVKNKKAVTSKK